MRDAPALTVENWSDRWTQREGFAKYAGEFAFPLWLPGERERTRESIAADRAYFEAVVAATKLRVAGEVREAYWAVRLAEADVAVSKLRRDEAQALANDVARRLRAGVVARLDAQTAQAQVHLADSALASAESALFRTRRAFEQLTGLKDVPPNGTERAGTAGAGTLHPALQAVDGAVDAARASLQLVAATGRDSPELGVGMFNERSRSADPGKNIVTLRLRIPFATEQRNAPRIAAANAMLMEVEANAELERARIEADVANAQRELQTAEQLLRLAQSRQALAADNRRLITRSFELGESDLPTRLRAQNEFLDAELAVRRAQIEQLRAVARLNQSLGLQP
jgi:cobalt-zinc-cadmium efflux system outer membrane protein